MATNFSPCKGSYVLHQFPSNVMFGMNGFHVSASGAIQGHHGPLVLYYYKESYTISLCLRIDIIKLLDLNLIYILPNSTIPIINRLGRLISKFAAF